MRNDKDINVDTGYVDGSSIDSLIQPYSLQPECAVTKHKPSKL